MMILQPFELLLDRRCAGKQHRHHDDRAQIGRDAVAQFQSGQDLSADLSGDRAVDDRDRNIRSGNESDDCQTQQRPGSDANRGDGKQDQRDNNRGNDRNHAHIAADAHIGIELKESRPERHPAPQFPLEHAAAGGDQVISRIAFPPVPRHFFRRLVHGASGSGYRLPGHVQFFTIGFARKLFDRAPVPVACRKIHRGEIAGIAQHGVDRTDAFEEFRPVYHRDKAHAHDDVANGHVSGALAQELLMHDLVGRCLRRRQPVVQPAQGRRIVGIVVTQALGEFDGEGRRPGRLIEPAQYG